MRRLKEARKALNWAPRAMGAVTAMTPGGFLPAATFTVRIVYARFTGYFRSLTAVMLHVVIPFAPETERH